MRVLVVLTVLFVLICAVAAKSDGCYIPKTPSKLDAQNYKADISEPSQKAVIVHVDGKEKLILEVSYKGKVSEFAWLIPTPSIPQVKKFDPPIFNQLHYAMRPNVKYWLNSIHVLHSLYFSRSAGLGKAAAGAPRVDVLERKQVGVYDVSVLQARDSGSLLTWLVTNGYAVKPELSAIFEDYISRGWIFTAARVNVPNDSAAQRRLNEGTLHALALDFATPQPIYPLRISSLNRGSTSLLLYVVSEHRVEERLLTTRCVLDVYDPYVQQAIREIDDDKTWLALRAKRACITKLSAELESKDMTSDLIFKQASSDTQFYEYASPPFLDNLGSMVLVVMLFASIPPIGAILAIACYGISRSSWGRRRAVGWRCLAVTLLVLWVPVSMMGAHMAYSGCEPVGIATIVAICAALLWHGRTRINRKKRCLSN